MKASVNNLNLSFSDKKINKIINGLAFNVGVNLCCKELCDGIILLQEFLRLVLSEIVLL